jgi:nitrite reductase (NO-forming)
VARSTPVTIGTARPPGPDPALTWRRRAAWHRRTALLPLGYLAAAIVAGGLAVAGFPVTWLWLHLLLLGAVSNAIVVWSAHFTAAILRAPAAERRGREAIRLAALNAGVLAVLAGGSAGPAWLGIAGAGVVFAAITAHLAALAGMARRALPARFTVVVWYYLAAGGALLTGIPAGAWMLAVPDDQRPRALLFHVQVNVLGWVVLTILGTLVTLWPTVLRAQVGGGATRAAKRGLVTCLAGLTLLALGTAFWLKALIGLGLVAFALGAAAALRPAVAAFRQRPAVTFSALSMAAGTGWLLVTLGWDGWAMLSAPDPEAAARHFDLLAVALAVGLAGQILIGALAYLLPVVLGGGPAVVRRNAASLDRHRIPRVVVFNAGLAALCWPPDTMVRIGGVVLVSVAVTAFAVPAAALAIRSRQAGNVPP